MDSGDNRRKGVLLVVAALAVLAAGVGFAVSSLRREATPSQPKFVQRPLDAPTSPSASRQAAPATSLVQASPTDLDALFEIFREGPPSVKEFAKEFAAEPELKQAYDEFKADQEGPDPKQTVEAFAHRLSERADFRALVSRFSQDAGFREAALKLANQSPQVAEAIRNIVASARVSRAAARTSRASIIGGRGPGSASATQGFGGATRATAVVSRSGGAGPQTSVGPGGAGAVAGGQAASAIGAVTAAPPGIGPGPGNGAKGSSSVPGPKGPEAHDVSPELGGIEEKPESEDMDKAIKEWLAANGINKDALWPLIGTYGLWGACFKIGKLADCDKACKNPPDRIATRGILNCNEPPGAYRYWQACLDAGYGELECVAECKKQDPPCTLNEEVVLKLCIKDIGNCTPDRVESVFNSIPIQCGDRRRVNCLNNPNLSRGNKCTNDAIDHAEKRQRQLNSLGKCGFNYAWLTDPTDPSNMCKAWVKTNKQPGFHPRFSDLLQNLKNCKTCTCAGGLPVKPQ